MAEFEQRIQLVTESEDEFMLSLVKLYCTANPTASTEDINRAIKRKFLSGVSPDLRRSIFIFCTHPYATSVTYDALLEVARKAKLHIINPSNDSLQTICFCYYPVVAEPTLQAVNELANKFNQHMALMDQRLSQQEAQLDAISQPPAQSNYRTFNNRNGFRRGPHRGPGNQQPGFKTTNANTAVSATSVDFRTVLLVIALKKTRQGV